MSLIIDNNNLELSHPNPQQKKEQQDLSWVMDLAKHKTESTVSASDVDRSYEVLKAADLDGPDLSVMLKVFKQLNLLNDMFMFYQALNDRQEKLALKLLEVADIDLKKEGHDILRAAARTGSVQIAEMVLAAGVDVNIKDPFGDSPLSALCGAETITKNHLEIARALLKSGARTDLRNESGRTALMEFELKSYKTDTPERLELFKLLTASGADVNAVDKNGKSLLSLLCAADTITDSHFQMAKELLDRGANADNKDAENQTPLMELIRAKASPERRMLINLLIGHGADVNAMDKSGRSLLKKALGSTDEEAISLLAAGGANIHEKMDGVPLVEIYLKNSDIPMVAALLNQSSQDACKTLEAFHKKFLLGHVNSIAIANGLSFNGSDSKDMLDEIRFHLKSLPPEFSSYISDGEKTKLIEAFASARTHGFNPLSAIQTGDLTVIPCGFSGHAIHLVFCNGYMAINNRGAGAPTHYFFATETVKAFKIDPTLMTADILKKLKELKLGNEAEAVEYIYKTLPSLLSPESNKRAVQDKVSRQLGTLSPKAQKIGNCAFAQSKTNARVGLALLKIKKDADGNGTLTSEDLQKATRFSKDLSTHIRLSILEDYLKGHPTEKSPFYDADLVKKAYKKLRKRLFGIPEIPLYTVLNQWKGRLEKVLLAERRKSLFMGIA